SFVCPISAFEQDMPHCLCSVPALALLGIGLVDSVEVCAEADLACSHLRNRRADRSV
ncbi:uncharacterized protein BDZ99DRAFT_341500, partial [Mytilinidion resinicola]